MTGVMWVTARRTASMAQSKQSPGVAAATTGSWVSPLRPKMACRGRPARSWSAAGRGAAALDVDDDQRQLGADGEADALHLQRDAGAGTGGDADGAAVGGADGGAHRGDLVLGLEGDDAVALHARQRVQHRRGGGDRIGAVEQVEAGQARPGIEAPGQRLGTGDGAVGAGLGGRGGNVEAADALAQFRRLAEGMAGAQRGDIGVHDLRRARRTSPSARPRPAPRRGRTSTARGPASTCSCSAATPSATPPARSPHSA
jgi:hypothetical protein